MLRRIAVVALALVAAQSGHAAGDPNHPFDRGNAFLRLCKNKHPEAGATGKVACESFVAGYVTAYKRVFNHLLIVEYPKFKPNERLSPSLSYFCLGEDKELEQITDVVVEYLQRHPESRHGDTGDLILKAMEEGFPCEP